MMTNDIQGSANAYPKDQPSGTAQVLQIQAIVMAIAAMIMLIRRTMNIYFLKHIQIWTINATFN